MASSIGKAATKKLVAKRFAPADPYYETYTDDRGKQKRRKRPLPPGLSKRDAAILRSVQKRAHILDKSFQIGGLKFGWTFVIGTVPLVGDVANLAVTHYLVVRKAEGADIPASLFRAMIKHNLISTGIGLVPALGDICVGIYKPNTRNAALLEEFLRRRGEEALRLIREEDERSSKSTRPGRKRGTWFTRSQKKTDQVNSDSVPVKNAPTWFKRSQKKTGQVNSDSVPVKNAPSETGAREPEKLKVDGPSTPRISPNSEKR